jgi:hypothetical protein
VQWSPFQGVSIFSWLLMLLARVAMGSAPTLVLGGKKPRVFTAVGVALCIRCYMHHCMHALHLHSMEQPTCLACYQFGWRWHAAVCELYFIHCSCSCNLEGFAIFC